MSFIESLRLYCCVGRGRGGIRPGISVDKQGGNLGAVDPFDQSFHERGDYGACLSDVWFPDRDDTGDN